WTRKHPENWNSEEVLDWLIYTGQEKGLNMSELRAEAFQNICGAELCRLSMDEFRNLEPKYGKSLYEMLRNLLSGKLSPFNNPSSSPVRSQYGSPTFYTMTNRKQESQHFNNAKNQHLWEFIFDCLVNPAYNPQYLRWENQRDGVFRFVQSEAVAQLWGGFKNNENMTYEKLSRAMRHYYKRGILERVEGRRLVYKFSRKAMDRAREKRHITL
ncbi:hypothetical protein LOTGIDRAFT_138494, partial [Lottia gigantea]